MKKPLFLFACLCLVKSAIALDVPEVVKNSFKQKFPNITNVKWEKEEKNEYEAEFKLDGKEMSSNFSADGKWLETETEISKEQVPSEVVSGLNKEFPKAKIKEAEKIEKADGSTWYEVEFRKGLMCKEKQFSSAGELQK